MAMASKQVVRRQLGSRGDNVNEVGGVECVPYLFMMRACFPYGIDEIS
jgi:hypothetical protein